MRHTYLEGTRKGTGVPVAAWLGMGVALLAIATGAGAVPSTARSAQGESSWVPSPALAAKLGPEVKIVVPGIGTYGIRPPRGLTLKREI